MDGPAEWRRSRTDVAVVLSVQLVATALVAGWFATGHSSAPDAGLQQLDVLSLSERVPGLKAVGGRPTMVVLSCDAPPPRTLDDDYGLLVSDDPTLARQLALPRALSACQDGYVLLDAASRVRYRTYDPGWADHAFEQEVLLEHLDLHPDLHPPPQAAP